MLNEEQFKNHELSFKERVESLIKELTLKEKVSQLTNISLDIDRFEIPIYDWRNESLHGVARAGVATVFPQAINLAATWNTDLMFRVAEAISIEARAKYHKAITEDYRKRWYGLTFAAPNVNIYRDPRWGRGQETFGEDPHLSGEMGISYIKGMQGNDPKYLRTVAEVKHFAVHSGPERARHRMNLKPSKKDFWETYLPAFRACIKKGKAFGVMSAYNRLYDKPCSASELLLTDILREKWGFEGYVISDGGAIDDIHKNHKVAKDYSEASAMAFNAGCDIMNPLNIMTKIKIKRYQKKILKGIENGFVSEEVIDQALKRIFMARMKLGMFDPDEMVPFTNIPFEKVDCKEHRDLAREAAQESIVLLKNENNLLPLSKDFSKIAVIGPNAVGLDPMIGNYSGEPSKYIDPLDGIKKKVSERTEILYAKGCDLATESKEAFEEAVDFATQSEIIIMFLGLTHKLEGEEGEVINRMMGDRKDLKLPGVQEDLLKKISEIGKPIVLVVTAGGPLDLSFAKQNIPAILIMWYAGEEGGNAIADVLFGDYNPSGRLPVTFYHSLESLGRIRHYEMQGRTYKYIKDPPLYPFGYGLSYTQFKYVDLKIQSEKVEIGEAINIEFEVSNIGDRNGQEVVQLYLSHDTKDEITPIWELKRFIKVNLDSGGKRRVAFELRLEDYCYVDKQGKRKIQPSTIQIFVGGGQPLKDFAQYPILQCEIQLIGNKLTIKE